ncbi:MAG TPA: CHAT domain-containing protein [Acidobacteria bacterium]|nr:CHAT domain-containing protein [Acidobacteriota bacterium]
MLDVPLPRDPEDRLWIAPHDVLFHVPWPALPVASGESLVESARFTLIPGAAAGAVLLQEAPRCPATAALSGSPSRDLPLVERELQELGETIPGARVVDPVGRNGFLEILGEHELVHLAGHAVFLDGLPMASGLHTSGEYVSVHDLAATRMAARFVSFGVCSGLRVAPAEGGRYAGFLLALMAGGVRTVTGPVAPVTDLAAYTFDLRFHQVLSHTGDPSRAYGDAIAAVRELDPSPGVWGNFPLYGDHRSWTIQ